LDSNIYRNLAPSVGNVQFNNIYLLESPIRSNQSLT
jgi:hypothetical protein